MFFFLVPCRKEARLRMDQGSFDEKEVGGFDGTGRSGSDPQGFRGSEGRDECGLFFQSQVDFSVTFGVWWNDCESQIV